VPSNNQGIPQAPTSRGYKESGNSQKSPSSNLATSTYRTKSYYPLDSPTLYWNLPPPTWDLDNVLTGESPSTPKKKRKRRRRQPAQPLEHKYTHAAFCHDPLCVYHR
jgi:hypothetical protein